MTREASAVEIKTVFAMRRAVDAMGDKERVAWHQHPEDPMARRLNPWRETDRWAINLAIERGEDPMELWVVPLTAMDLGAQQPEEQPEERPSGQRLYYAAVLALCGAYTAVYGGLVVALAFAALALLTALDDRR